MWIKVLRFLGQLLILMLLLATLVFFDFRAKKKDADSLEKHSKPIVGTFESRGKRSSIFWTFRDGNNFGRIPQSIYFEGAVMGEQYHSIYDSTDLQTGRLDLLRPFLDNKVVDTTYAVEVLNFPLKQTSSSILYTYKVENVAYKRKLPIRKDEASVSYRNGKRWMVVYVVENPKMGYLYPLE